MEPDTRHPSQPASGSPAVRGDRARIVYGQVMGLVALTVGCLALSAYMGCDLTGGAGIALSVGAVICLVGLNAARPTRAITHELAAQTRCGSRLSVADVDPVKRSSQLSR
jgi:hypothetical protein